MDVGFIGLGQMGHGMAKRLIDAGHTVTVWNRDPSRAAAFASAGASVVASPAEAASTGAVITMLANDAALEAVSFGKDGIMSAGPSLRWARCWLATIDQDASFAGRAFKDSFGQNPLLGWRKTFWQ